MFFINNLWALVISIVIIVFLVLMGIKIVREINLNSLLKQKHSFMRVDYQKREIGFKKRIGLLTSTALSPIAVVAIVLMVGSTVSKIPSGEVRNFDSASDITSLYSDMSGLLPRLGSAQSLDETLKFEQGNESSDIIDSYTVEGLYNTVTTSRVSGSVYGGENYENIVYNDDNYFEALDGSVEITLNSNNGVTKEGTQFVDSIMYTGASENCENGYLLQGLHLTNEYLVVVALEYPESCLGVVMDDLYVHSHLNVLISVFDVEDLTLKKNYRLSGNLRSVTFDDNNVYVTTKRYLDYNSENFDITKYLPFYKIDGFKTTLQYQDLIYVEGTTPDSFTTVYGINIIEQEVDMETALVDYKTDVFVTNSEVEVVGIVYYFDPLAGMFEFENPIDEMKYFTLKFTLSNGGVVYSGNKIE